MSALPAALFALSGLSLAVAGALFLGVRRHLRRPPPRPSRRQPASILKPLCGVDDELFDNLASFAELDHPDYEVVLGVHSVHDPAYRVARQAQLMWPKRFRLVIQQGQPGLNPKVNQLIGLARAARHEVLVISDSNIRVEPGYLSELVALLEDPEVGLVTNAMAGVGERTMGALIENLQLGAGTGPSMIAAKVLADRDIVVGKSMAFRRADLAALGGFEAFKDLLAEDYVMGRRISRELGKRVEVARQVVLNVAARRTLGDFVRRYARWGVIQRQMVGTLVYSLQIFLNPFGLATLAMLAVPSAWSLALWSAVGLLRIGLDLSTLRCLRPREDGWGLAVMAPLKDLLMLLAWGIGLVQSQVVWRGNRLRVLEGTRLEPCRPAVSSAIGSAPVSPVAAARPAQSSLLPIVGRARSPVASLEIS